MKLITTYLDFCKCAAFLWKVKGFFSEKCLNYFRISTKL